MIAREFQRKAIHIATAILPVAWAFGWLTGTQVRMLVAAAVVVALVVEFARYRSATFGARFEARFGALLRAHERTTLSGATWLAIGMWGAVMLAPPGAAIAALWAAAVGDAAAGLVGRSMQHLRGAPADSKSIVGSLALTIATAGGVLWLTPASRGVAIALGVVAAFAERPSRPGDDNVRVVLVVAGAAALLGLR